MSRKYSKAYIDSILGIEKKSTNYHTVIHIKNTYSRWQNILSDLDPKKDKDSIKIVYETLEICREAIKIYSEESIDLDDYSKTKGHYSILFFCIIVIIISTFWLSLSDKENILNRNIAITDNPIDKLNEENPVIDSLVNEWRNQTESRLKIKEQTKNNKKPIVRENLNDIELFNHDTQNSEFKKNEVALDGKQKKLQQIDNAKRKTKKSEKKVEKNADIQDNFTDKCHPDNSSTTYDTYAYLKNTRKNNLAERVSVISSDLYKPNVIEKYDIYLNANKNIEKFTNKNTKANRVSVMCFIDESGIVRGVDFADNYDNHFLKNIIRDFAMKLDFNPATSDKWPVCSWKNVAIYYSRAN